MSIAKISELLTLLIKKIGIEGFTAYQIKHASTIKLAEMGKQESDLNIFTNYAPDFISARNYYICSQKASKRYRSVISDYQSPLGESRFYFNERLLIIMDE
ncbi:MAG: hypothetical protein EZS28_027998 [Streblomastix strix]|uniref:Tyr recombinase domain-containing protein n=1 Tax=Streblomastix strix TaxID=222440 RepID=A0A5J4V350_9EUKA|nr:MAG: hypothetical protein EZS28_027998 [Streblomastix strix]